MAAFGTFTPIPAGPDGRRIRAPIYRATRPAISKRKNKVLDSSDEETWSLSSEDEDEQDDFERVTFRRQQFEACEDLDVKSKALTTLHSIRTWVYFRRSQLEILGATHPQEKEDDHRLVSMWNDLAPHIKDEWDAKADEHFEQEENSRRYAQLKRDKAKHEKWLDRERERWRQTARRTSLSSARRKQLPPTPRVARPRLDAQKKKYGALGPTPPSSLASTPHRTCTPLPPLDVEDFAAFAAKYALESSPIQQFISSNTSSELRSPTVSVSAPSLLDPASPGSINSDDTVYAIPTICKENTPVLSFDEEHRPTGLSLSFDNDLAYVPDMPSPHDASQEALVPGFSGNGLNLLPHLSPVTMEGTETCDPLSWISWERDLHDSSNILDHTALYDNQQGHLIPDMDYFMSNHELSMLTANIPDPGGLPEIDMMDFRFQDLLALPAGPIPNDIDVSVDLAKAMDHILDAQLAPTQSSAPLCSETWQENGQYSDKSVPPNTACPRSLSLICSANHRSNWQPTHHQHFTSSSLPKKVPIAQYTQPSTFHFEHNVSPVQSSCTLLHSSQVYPIYHARSEQDILPTHVFIPVDY